MNKQRFPQMEQEVSQVIENLLVLSLSRDDPLFSRLPDRPTYEGETFSVVQDGATADVEFAPVEHVFVFERELFESTDFEKFMEILCEGIETLKEEKHRTFYAQLDKILERQGQSRKGVPFTCDTFIEALEMIDLAFDDDGKWIPPNLVIHPNMASTVEDVLNQIYSDPVKKRKLDTLLDRKREEYLAKKANRKLVD
jgi:hypothetical protein